MEWMNVTWPEPHKNKNIILPETAIDNQQNRYDNGQDSWAVYKGVDPKKESKSRHTCKRRWTTYCCIVSVELRRNFTTASLTHMWTLKIVTYHCGSAPTCICSMWAYKQMSIIRREKLLYSLQASWETKIKKLTSFEKGKLKLNIGGICVSGPSALNKWWFYWRNWILTPPEESLAGF